MAITQVNVGTPSNEILFNETSLGNAADAVKASSATLYYAVIDNSLNGAATYVKLYNLASGSVTVGTTVPDEVIFVPANARITHIFHTVGALGKVFATALSCAAVTTGGTAGTTSPASAVPVTLSYS